MLLHGGSGRWQGRDASLQLLAKRWHVYAPDLRGHGRSGRIPDCYTLHDFSTDICTFIREVVRAPAVIYGHSLGGEIAVMAAATVPDLVRALVVGDAPLAVEDHPTEEPAHHEMNQLWRTLGGRSMEVVQAGRRQGCPGPATTWDATTRGRGGARRARALVALVAGWADGRTVYAVVDSAYAARPLLEGRPANVNSLSHLRPDAALWARPGRRRPGQRGRPRRKGHRLPMPTAMAATRQRWDPLPVSSSTGGRSPHSSSAAPPLVRRSRPAGALLRLARPAPGIVLRPPHPSSTCSLPSTGTHGVPTFRTGLCPPRSLRIRRYLGSALPK
ncbi:MAG: alpha/beta hydrolase [Chloroflexi bacterium]|nr:alpha/beta hydrolase [Chloroflexota bacterium]